MRKTSQQVVKVILGHVVFTLRFFGTGVLEGVSSQYSKLSPQLSRAAFEAFASSWITCCADIANGEVYNTEN